MSTICAVVPDTYCAWCTLVTLVLQVATFLLSLAFLYDIFWVFISPQLFGESVMVKVATGGEITQDPTFCEKYPYADGCQVCLVFKTSPLPAREGIGMILIYCLLARLVVTDSLG